MRYDHNNKKQEESTYNACCPDMFCRCGTAELDEKALRVSNELYSLEKEEYCYRDRKERLHHRNLSG